MTSNQRRAITLAATIRQFGLSAGDVTDGDWTLLLLAAGLNNCRALPLVVAQRVLEQADRSVGYFAASTEEETALVTQAGWHQEVPFAWVLQ